VLAQKIPINTRLIIKTFQIARRDQLHQVAIAFYIFRQKNQMVSGVITPLFFLQTAPGSHIHLTSQEGLYPLLLRLFVKIYHSVHVAVIRNRNSRHPQLTGFSDHILNTCRSV
jgi:hypothetical protein